jgi:hypothetical protein
MVLLFFGTLPRLSSSATLNALSQRLCRPVCSSLSAISVAITALIRKLTEANHILIRLVDTAMQLRVPIFHQSSPDTPDRMLLRNELSVMSDGQSIIVVYALHIGHASVINLMN